MRHRAANRAFVAGLEMTDERQRAASNGSFLARRSGQASRRFCVTAAPTSILPRRSQMVSSSAIRAISTRIAGSASAQIEHRHERLPAGQNTRLVSVLGEHRDRLVDCIGADIVERPRLHGPPPSISAWMRRGVAGTVHIPDTERISDGIGDACRHAHAIAFRQALGAERGQRRQRFLVQHLDVWDFAHRRHEIIGEGAGEERALFVVNEFLIERRGNALREGAAHLPISDHRIEDAAGIVHRNVAIDADLIGQRIDLDAAHVEHETVSQRCVDAVVARRRLELRRRPQRGLAQSRRHAFGQQHRRPVRGAGDTAEWQRSYPDCAGCGSCRRRIQHRPGSTLSCFAAIAVELVAHWVAAM